MDPLKALRAKLNHPGPVTLTDEEREFVSTVLGPAAAEQHGTEIGGMPCPMKYKPPNRSHDITETCEYEAGHGGPCKFPSSVERQLPSPFCMEPDRCRVTGRCGRAISCND